MILALSYSGRDEIVRMVKQIASEARAQENATPSEIDEKTIAAHLDTAGVPDPDLLIRTSGEMRISNFYLWQIAYSELYVTPTLWPDFREKEYLQALLDFQRRRRRFGRTDEQLKDSSSLRWRPVDANLSSRVATAAVGVPLLVLLVGWSPPWLFSAVFFIVDGRRIARVFCHGVSASVEGPRGGDSFWRLFIGRRVSR